jgi:hypothetical protein
MEGVQGAMHAQIQDIKLNGELLGLVFFLNELFVYLNLKYTKSKLHGSKIDYVVVLIITVEI